MKRLLLIPLTPVALMAAVLSHQWATVFYHMGTEGRGPLWFIKSGDKA